jgi:hypothetical protein
MSAEHRPDASLDLESHDEQLAPRIERLRRLRSAWSLLAPAGASTGAAEIGETGRAVTDHLQTIVSSRSDVTGAALIGIDTLLSEFETSIQHVATSIPVSQLRSSLPVCRESDRRGLLDLLDVLIAEDKGLSGRIEDRIGPIDYLITLACTRDTRSGNIQFDPVTLPERLAALCLAADDAEDPRLAEIEAEFFAAANLDAEDLRAELQQRALRKLKIALGRSYFAPRVLRSIVTYNTALVARVADEILESSDWGEIENETLPPVGSVFECEAVLLLADAVRRRARGKDAAPNAIDRIAWTLDFEYLADNEQKALCEDALATKEDPLGTAILLGLVSRSLAVLSVELQDVGIAPDTVSDIWVPELSELFQKEINRYIAEDAYKVACALSELKNKFLLSPLPEQHRPPRAPSASSRTRASERKPTRGPTEDARSLVLEALEKDRSDGNERASQISIQQLPWPAIARRALAVSLAALLAFALLSDRNPDLDRMSADQLEAISPYLEAGRRSGEGHGLTFVGEINPAWRTLPVEERERIAVDLVDRLRAEGIQQVMIYDERDQIRIQALGTQSTRVL